MAQSGGNTGYIQFHGIKSMFEPYVGATDRINNAVKEVTEQEVGEDEGEEEGEKGGEEYSDNFEDAESPEGLDTEQTGEPQRPSAPVCHT